MGVEPRTILDLYRRDRDEAETGAQKARVWRMYAWAVLATFAERSLSSTMDVRRSPSDEELPIRYAGYWRTIHDDDLRDLWVALERARYS
jgi:hypothetical protein